MQLNELKASHGAKKRRKIVGRGKGSGHGGTSCRGSNGQKSRSGKYLILSSEGGQMPLIRRLPKVGFNPHRPVINQIVKLEDLNKIANGTVIDRELLKKEGLIKSINRPFKILAGGELKKNLVFKVESISKTAREKILKAGGKIEEPASVSSEKKTK